MNLLEIAIAVVVGVGFFAAMGVIIYKKVKQKGGCNCGCSDCSDCHYLSQHTSDGSFSKKA